jgi:predicted XRE-type DNA-binding protein
MATKNVFAELGLSSDTAAVEAWRSDLARIIRDYFKRSGMTQTQLATRLGLKQSVVSKIITGKLVSLSIEFLLRQCVKLETRGCAAWGPSPDEAFATSDVTAVMGTATETVQFSGEGVIQTTAPTGLRSQARNLNVIPARNLH